jgi:hypothetical protein
VIPVRPPVLQHVVRGDRTVEQGGRVEPQALNSVELLQEPLVDGVQVADQEVIHLVLSWPITAGARLCSDPECYRRRQVDRSLAPSFGSHSDDDLVSSRR